MTSTDFCQVRQSMQVKLEVEKYGKETKENLIGTMLIHRFGKSE